MSGRAILLYAVAPLVFLVAALAVWRTLLPACEAAPWPGRLLPGYCPAPGPTPERSALEAELERGRALQEELRMLERRLAALDDCPPAPEIRRVQPPPETPEEHAEAAPREDPEAIDPERWEKRDITLMEGCWNLDSDYELVERRTGKPITADAWRACFDATGKGTQSFKLSNGMECEGPITAAFRDDGTMALADGGDVPCTGGSVIVRRQGECRMDGKGGAACEMRDGRGATRVELRRDG